MNFSQASFVLVSAAVLSLGAIQTPARSQIIPDTTLPNNSIVLPDGNVFTINGGTEAGINLFHSFQDFSIPTGGEAVFNNALTIENIITRVTGGNFSDIDGLIRANGGANLFLINPNGIQFGPNAQLDIGGSFLGSTAESLLFEDGSFYSAKDANAPPLLSVNVPVGLQMGTNPGDIQVNGAGHTLTSERPILSPIERGESLSGLQVPPARTLAFVGGNINLDGGVLLADSGRIELGSVDSGVVRLDAATQGWALDYEAVQSFRDIHLFDRSLVDASGFLGNGSIQIQGRNLSLSDGSVVLVQNVGEQASGAIRINASESVEIGGFLREIGITSGFFNETLGSGAAGDIEISTRVLTLQDGGMALARTFSDAKGGSIIANASESIDIIGFASPDSIIRTALLSSAFDTGDAEFGVDGLVSVNNPIVDPASGLVTLDANPLNPNTQIQDSCEIATRSRFSIVGSGGLPEDPTQSLQPETVWQDTRLGEIQSHLTPNSPETESQAISVPTVPLVEATGWRQNDRGQIELVAASGNPAYSSWQPHPDCESLLDSHRTSSTHSAHPESSRR